YALQPSSEQFQFRSQVSPLLYLPNVLESEVEKQQEQHQGWDPPLDRYLQVSHVNFLPHGRILFKITRANSKNRVLFDTLDRFFDQELPLFKRSFGSRFFDRVPALVAAPHCAHAVDHWCAGHNQQDHPGYRCYSDEVKAPAPHTEVPKAKHCCTNKRDQSA